MSKFILLIVTAASFSVLAEQQEKSISQIHRDLCAVAVDNYPKVMPTVEECIANTDIEIGPDDYRIEFASCNSGEWVAVVQEYKSEEILVGSSGLEDDVCE